MADVYRITFASRALKRSWALRWTSRAARILRETLRFLSVSALAAMPLLLPTLTKIEKILLLPKRLEIQVKPQLWISMDVILLTRLLRESWIPPRAVIGSGAGC